MNSKNCVFNLNTGGKYQLKLLITATKIQRGFYSSSSIGIYEEGSIPKSDPKKIIYSDIETDYLILQKYIMKITLYIPRYQMGFENNHLSSHLNIEQERMAFHRSGITSY